MLFRLQHDFPLADVETIGARLQAGGGVVPGYTPPVCGPLAPDALISAVQLDKLRVVVLPDLNIVSHIVEVARDGAPGADDATSRLAVDLMAICQAMDLQIEPSIAFHELASTMGNAVAHEKLAWFRTANKNAYRQWLDLAMRRLENVELGPQAPLSAEDLAFPLKRFRRNYIVALKVAALELGLPTVSPVPERPLEKALALLRWMHEDFMLAGPAAVFAAFYFSPTRKKRLIKRLRAKDREQALQGVANAAWDMTHLSDFVLRSSSSDADGTRMILATADKGLATMAPVLLSAIDPEDERPLLVDCLRTWWPESDAVTLAQAFKDTVARENHPERPPPKTGPSVIDGMIAEGEATVRAWKP